MPKTNWQDHRDEEILSIHITGLQDAVGKMEDALGLGTIEETDVSLIMVPAYNTSGILEYRIYQAPVGKRNWLASSAPVVKKNGSVITTGFSIDYGGGAILLDSTALNTDTFTASFTRTNSTPAVSAGNVTQDATHRFVADTEKESWNNKLDSIADGSITDAKLSSEAGQIKQVVNNHLADYASKFPNNAGAHNSIYRGKYLGSSATTEQYTAISSGTFEDLYIGDYWTIDGVNYRIAAFNYYMQKGDTATTVNHITLVPDTSLYLHVMNDTNITTGGYMGSKMYTTGLEQAKTTIKNAFSGHVLKHRKILSNAVADGKASGWAWFDSEVDLMNEVMVYGSVVWGESVIGGSGYNLGEGMSQLPLFTLRPDMISNRQYFWLRDVVSASRFATVHSLGFASSDPASYAYGVRPAFSIS